MFVRYFISFNFLPDHDNSCHAAILAKLPCLNFPEKQATLHPEFVSPETKFLDSYMHRHWGRYEESSHSRYHETDLYSDSWENLNEKIEIYLEEQHSILKQITENYNKMVETQPENYSVNFKL
jgi:hypothetical protein